MILGHAHKSPSQTYACNGFVHSRGKVILRKTENLLMIIHAQTTALNGSTNFDEFV